MNLAVDTLQNHPRKTIPGAAMAYRVPAARVSPQHTRHIAFYLEDLTRMFHKPVKTAPILLIFA